MHTADGGWGACIGTPLLFTSALAKTTRPSGNRASFSVKTDATVTRTEIAKQPVRMRGFKNVKERRKKTREEKISSLLRTAPKMTC